MKIREVPKDIYYNPKEFRSKSRTIDAPALQAGSRSGENSTPHRNRTTVWAALAFAAAGAAIMFIVLIATLVVAPNLLQRPYVIADMIIENAISYFEDAKRLR